MITLTYSRFVLPAIMAIIFVGISQMGYFYLFPFILLLFNGLNLIWGEFSEKEIKRELRSYYGCRHVHLLKQASAMVLLGMIAWSLWHIDSANPSLLYFIGFALCTGCITGCFVVTLAHDLLHSRKKVDLFLSAMLLLSANIPHLAADHVFGHHRKVGLREDANTAKLNQDFYRYFFILAIDRIRQSYFQMFGMPGYVKKRIFRLNMIMTFAQVGVWALIFIVAANPLQTLALFLLQGAIAYFLYELINYIQHYGLSRKHADAEISQELSWNCYYKYTNYILHMLPLHSLHHLPASKRRMHDSELKAGPRMPYVYFVMVAMALIPPPVVQKNE